MVDLKLIHQVQLGILANVQQSILNTIWNIF